MLIERKIKDYLYLISNGVIKLNYHQCKKIIDIVTGETIQNTAFARFHRWNVLKHEYEFLYSINTDNETIEKLILQTLEQRPVYNVYWYALYNSAGLFQGNVYTVNNNLL